MFDHHNGAPQEVVRHAGEVLLQKTRKHAWDYVPHSKQQERGTRRALDRENAREVQIVRDDGLSSLPRELDKRFVRCRLQTEIANVDGGIP